MHTLYSDVCFRLRSNFQEYYIVLSGMKRWNQLYRFQFSCNRNRGIVWVNLELQTIYNRYKNNIVVNKYSKLVLKL